MFIGVFIWVGIVFFVQFFRYIELGEKFDFVSATSLSNFGAFGDSFGLITSLASLVMLVLVKIELSHARTAAERFQQQAIKKESLDFWKKLIYLIPDKRTDEEAFFDFYDPKKSELKGLEDEFERISPLYNLDDKNKFRDNFIKITEILDILLKGDLFSIG